MPDQNPPPAAVTAAPAPSPRAATSCPPLKFGPEPAAYLEHATAERVLALLHKDFGGVLARAIGMAITGHEPAGAARSRS